MTKRARKPTSASEAKRAIGRIAAEWAGRPPNEVNFAILSARLRRLFPDDESAKEAIEKMAGELEFYQEVTMQKGNNKPEGSQ